MKITTQELIGVITGRPAIDCRVLAGALGPIWDAADCEVLRLKAAKITRKLSRLWWGKLLKAKTIEEAFAASGEGRGSSAKLENMASYDVDNREVDNREVGAVCREILRVKAGKALKKMEEWRGARWTC